MKRYKTGIFIGKFYPLHMGHFSTLLTLSKVCERSYLIFYNSPIEEEKIAMQLKQKYDIDSRIKDARNALITHKNISVIKIEIPQETNFPKDFRRIKKLVEKSIGCKADVQIFGEEEKELYIPYKYTDEYILGPIFEVKSPDNNLVPLHASLIRNNYSFYKKYLPKAVRESMDRL